MASKKSPRTVRRETERANAKLVRDREKLAALETGGAKERPIDVASASVVEAHARSKACVQCGGAVKVDDHVVVDHQGERLRAAHTKCLTCSAPRTLYFRIAQPN